MWGGRFEGGPADLMRSINSSIGTDKRLWREDVAASRADTARSHDRRKRRSSKGLSR